MAEYKEIYPNSPLVEVVFEVRFPGEPGVECNRDIFYEKIRGDFSNVLVYILSISINTTKNWIGLKLQEML